MKTPKSWPAASVEMRPLAGLMPYANNARTHSEEQVSQIAASMKEWGWTNPVLVDEAGMIIAGHGRVLAAKQLGFDQVPVMTAKGWTKKQKAAYVLADNRIATNAEWDMGALAAELGELKTSGFDVALTGFTDDDLKGLLSYSGPSGVTEVLTTEVDDKFWISIRGPLALQAQTLAKVKELAKAISGIDLDLGVISLDP